MKRGTVPLHSDSAPPPKKRKLSQTNTNEPESSVSPDALTHGRYKPGQIVYEDNDFQFQFLYNDQQEKHLIALTDLKQIFAACLPRMGTRYVTRHVFDEHHRLICCRSKTSTNNDTNSLSHHNNKNTMTQLSHSNNAWNRNDINRANITFPVQYPVIGGICIRPFYEQHFGEVVFLAVHNSHQHKSVGRKIMRVMKHVAIQEQLRHFYTYADNQAIGFFQKMGFVKKKGASSHHKQHSLSAMHGNHNTHNPKKELFWDYIKHYTGSELMECKLYPKVDYIKLDDHIRDIEKDILLQCQMYRKQQFNTDFETEYEPIQEFLIPINKLIVILDLDDNFDNEQDDEKLIDTMHKYGIKNDRDLYDNYKTNDNSAHLQQILHTIFNKKRADEIYHKFITYLTKPNDQKVSSHIDLKVDVINGVKPEWKNLNNENVNHRNNKDINLNTRRSARFFPVRMKAKWILKRVMKNDDAYPFNEPVPKSIPLYYDQIKHPMDMKTMSEKNEKGLYLEWKHFDQDFKLMIANCKEFNKPNSEIVKMSIRLNEYYEQCCIKYDRTMADKY